MTAGCWHMSFIFYLPPELHENWSLPISRWRLVDDAESAEAVISGDVSADAAFWHGNDWKFLITSQQRCTLSWLWGFVHSILKQLEHIIRTQYLSIFHPDSCGQWLILVIRLFPTVCHKIQKMLLPASHRPASVAHMFNLHYIDLSVRLPCIQYNLVPVTPPSARLITLPFASTGRLTSRSRSVLPILIFDFFFFQGHCLQFTRAWQNQSRLVSIEHHRATCARL